MSKPTLRPILAVPASLALVVGGFVGGLSATAWVEASAASDPSSLLTPGAAQDAGQGSVFSTPSFATGDSNGSMIAVTGVDITGASVLYLIDTEQKQLACYQATGGSSSTQGVKLIGARRIDLDLQLHGFKDRSDYDYRALEREFSQLEADGDE